MSVLIKNGRVVTATDDYFGDIWIVGEKVSQIGADLSHLEAQATTVIDATGKLVIPGGIDPHTHLDMPFGGSFTADDFDTGTKAAAFGGTTTVIDFAIQRQGTSTLEGLDAWHARADGKATIDYGFHMIITDMPEARLPEIDTLIDRGVSSYKMFMAYPGVLYADDATHYRTYCKVGEVGGLVSLHAENGIVIDEIIKKEVAKGHTEPLWHGLTRPARMAAEAVYRAAAIAEVANVPLYIVHLDCVEAFEEIKRARARGVDVKCETCPQYLYFSLDDLAKPDFEGAKYVMSPPLRDKSGHEALWKGLATGEIQAMATDHAPFNFKGQKEMGREVFTKIPNGGPGIENRLTMTYQGVVQGRFDLHRWVDACCTQPAKIFGMFPKKGTVAVGSDADIVVFDPERTETISVNNEFTHHMNVDYSSFEGFEAKGWSETVLSRGRVIVDKGSLETSGGGEYIKRAQVGKLLR
jgi:dihydropyrimidinase